MDGALDMGTGRTGGMADGGAGEMVLVAVPLAAGVGAVALCPDMAAPGLAAICTICLVIITLLMLSASRPGGAGVKVALAAFACGVMCHCMSLLRGPVEMGGPVVEAAQRCALRAHAVIDGMSFDDMRCAPLLKALLTGDRSDLPRDVVAVFRSSGASHLLALSGLHLGFIYMMIRRLSLLLPWRGRSAAVCRAAATAAISGFYALMTGAGPSIVRALLFICISELGSICPARRREPGRTLLAALTVQLSLCPGVISSVGFQLSYLAMAGIVWIFPRINSWWPESPRRAAWPGLRRVWTAAALSISCQLTTAPLAWMYFHTFPKYFLLTNILAIPLTSAVMALSVAAVLLSSLSACPGWLITLDSHALTLLLGTLETISAM